MALSGEAVLLSKADHQAGVVLGPGRFTAVDPEPASGDVVDRLVEQNTTRAQAPTAMRRSSPCRPGVRYTM